MNPPLQKSDEPAFTLAIAANFVADPIGDSLNFWFRKLRLNCQLQLAPYDQILQQLLDPQALARCDYGLILIQLERWISLDCKDPESEILRTVRDFINALEAATQKSASAFIVVLCPPSPTWRGHSAIRSAEEHLDTCLREHPQVDLVASGYIQELYPTEDYAVQFDSYTNETAETPYSSLGFATLGTVVARRIRCLRSQPRKVIVVDCDNTLWSGLCGEEGPLNVRVTLGRKALQSFLIKQQTNGRLICLCSKNEEKNVREVFSHHPDMVLCADHLTAWKVNWGAKSVNLQALSNELSLGLDSFVFIDDDTFECETVRALCPEVRTLQLPQEDSRIEAFLRNTWDLDSKKITAEDQNRARYYRRNLERTQAQDKAPSLEDFLRNLQLEVLITPLKIEDVARAVQLTERTNQFNLNGVRRSASYLTSLIRDGRTKCLTVSSRDRFGEHGMVGLVIYSPNERALTVNTLLLSCRALGKRIEHRLFLRLADEALQSATPRLEFSYSPTAKNLPLRSFLAGLGISPNEKYWVIASEDLQRATHRPASVPSFSTAG
jgi:FkbH-like protein